MGGGGRVVPPGRSASASASTTAERIRAKRERWGPIVVASGFSADDLSVDLLVRDAHDGGGKHPHNRVAGGALAHLLHVAERLKGCPATSHHAM